MTAWYEGPLCGFDLETTGVDVEADRIVTACAVRCGGGAETLSRTWLSDVDGMEIPEGASAVHGVSTEQARADGRPAADVVAEVVEMLASAAHAGTPLIAMNAAFDFTILDRECDRHGIKSLWARAVPVVIDPRVLDKQVDRYRKGGRTLTDLCAHYSVPLDGAHAADADAIAACRVAWRIGSRYPKVGALNLRELHDAQVGWAREQADGLADYFRKTPGKESWADGVRTEWPLIPAPRGGEQ